MSVQDALLERSGEKLAGPFRAASPASGLKRVLYLGVSGVALALAAPLLLLLALLIKLDSRGPVLFRQCRIGQGGRPFEIFKFRTMHVLENGPSILQASKNDPRVTRVGRHLRALSLDELPQLLNVFAGDMSLVGPRPHARAHDEAFERALAPYAGRRAVKPGLTGLAQVNGFRGPVTSGELLERRTELDLLYVRKQSLALDLTILAQTPLEILRGRNAV